MSVDVRWRQRLNSFNKAFLKLEDVVMKLQNDGYFSNAWSDWDDIIKEGLIQRFEYTHELAWNVMKDYALYQGNSEIGGSRDATREALKLKLIADGDVWMEMIKSRNLTSHSYDEFVANEIFEKIIHEYYPAFCAFGANMEAKLDRLD